MPVREPSVLVIPVAQSCSPSRREKALSGRSGIDLMISVHPHQRIHSVAAQMSTASALTTEERKRQCFMAPPEDLRNMSGKSDPGFFRVDNAFILNALSVKGFIGSLVERLLTPMHCQSRQCFRRNMHMMSINLSN
jgi:hypothetical protein